MKGAFALDTSWWPVYDTHGKAVALMTSARYNAFVRYLYYPPSHRMTEQAIAMACHGDFRVRGDVAVDDTVSVAYLKWKVFEFYTPEREDMQRVYNLVLVHACPEFFKEPGVVDLREQWV